MDARREGEATPMKNRTTVERKSEREIVVTRTFNGPARIVFEAWREAQQVTNRSQRHAKSLIAVRRGEAGSGSADRTEDS